MLLLRGHQNRRRSVAGGLDEETQLLLFERAAHMQRK
jgi:hypothetical protein